MDQHCHQMRKTALIHWRSSKTVVLSRTIMRDKSQ
nr:MAG TPA: hypothetical protein [Caudoviricetes sp.]